MGAWQPESFPGFRTRAAVGAPGWFETLTTAYGDAVAFYEDAFGWDTHVVSDTADFRYTTLGVDQDARAGIMDGSAFLGDEPSRGKGQCVRGRDVQPLRIVHQAQNRLGLCGGRK